MNRSHLFCVAIFAFVICTVDARSCTTDSDCPGSSCTCYESEVCINLPLVGETGLKCPTCTDDSDCPGLSNTCNANLSKCTVCVERAVEIGTKECGTSPVTKPSGGSSKDCQVDSDCSKSGCTCLTDVEGIGNFCGKRSILGTIPSRCPCTETDPNTVECVSCVVQIVDRSKKSCGVNGEKKGGPSLCISTAFLLERGLGHAAIRHVDSANVLCIPGLPCATNGHLLRQCTSNGSCKLVSYGEVCKHRLDCVASHMPVSQLKHSFDWSEYRTESARDSGVTLTLTSLSAHPDATGMMPSLLVAKTTDFLNKLGLGHVCDAIAALPHRLYKVEYAHSSIISA